MRPLFPFASKLAVLVALAGGALGACNSSDAAKAADAGYPEHIDFCALPVSCREIVLACHPKDDGTNKEINDCHETAHDKGTDSACKAVQADCVAKCNAAPALEGGIIEKFGPCDGGAGAHDH